MTIPYKKLILITFCAFLIRAIVFTTYVQHEQRYWQPDSPDYHLSGITLSLGKGMIRLGTPFPFFWRAPGYPWYLSHFFSAYGVKNLMPEANTATHKAALWVQIALASCVPAILFLLALSLTGSLFIAWLTAGITTVHPGFVLSSMFLLTEGIALIFFFLFLLFFYQSFRALGEPTFAKPTFGEPTFKKSNHKKNSKNVAYYWIVSATLAGLMLGLATWLRPMGEYVAIVASVIILLFANSSFRKKLLLILVIFSTLLICLL